MLQKDETIFKILREYPATKTQKELYDALSEEGKSFFNKWMSKKRSRGIQYVLGDATAPYGDSPGVIVHCCNDMGAWGSGFVVAISKRWPEPEMSYRAWKAGDVQPFELGEVKIVQVQEKLWVANIIGQRGYGKPSDANYPFIRYEAIEKGLNTVADFAHNHGAWVHMPRLGCGLAGGEWSLVEPILKRTLQKSRVFVYDL